MSLQLNITYGSGVTSQSAAFQAQFATAANAAVQFFEHTFTNNVAVNISLDYAALGGNAIASNSFSLQGFYPYATVRAALASHVASSNADDAVSIANLPLADPGNATKGYVLTNAQATALGIGNFSGQGTAVDDMLTVNSNLTFNFDPNNRNAAGNFDLIGVLEHEISEGVFGRIQNENADSNLSNSVLDLFRYTAAGNGTRTYVPGNDGWFSIDGTHNLERFNNTGAQSGDLADWYPAITGDSFGNGSTGIASLVTPTDLRVLDVIGWTRAPATVMDFNGDGVSDILFTNTATGDLGYYGMNGSNQGWSHIGSASTAYSIVGTGDFIHNYTSDILYRNNTTGDLGFYVMSKGGNGSGSGNTPGNDVAGTLASWVHIGGSSTAYSVVGVGEFGDANAVHGAEILFRNNSNGDMGFYSSAGGTFNNWSSIGGSSTSYSVAGLGDFHGDGVSDILFRNASTGDFGYYNMVNGANQGWVSFGGSSTSYSVVGIGDFYGVGSGHGGTSDILFRNAATGDTGFFAVSGGALGAWHSLGATSTAYSVVAIGDYYGNGVDDILFRNNATGDTGFYAMSNGVNTGWHALGSSSTAYSIVGDTTTNGVGTGESHGNSLTQTAGGPTTAAPLSQTLGGGDTGVHMSQTLGGDVVTHLSQTMGGNDISAVAQTVGANAALHLTETLGHNEAIVSVIQHDHNLFS